MEEYFYFWGHTQKEKNKIDKSCLSQWYNVKFTINNIEYNNAEQYMMAKKAILFKDEEILEKIMNKTSLKKIKNLGRKVKNFDSKRWDIHSEQYVLEGNLAKFQQNENLKEFLLSTTGIIVEASPYDKIWGIGLLANDTKAKNKKDWQGENKLGYILTEVRERLR